MMKQVSFAPDAKRASFPPAAAPASSSAPVFAQEFQHKLQAAKATRPGPPEKTQPQTPLAKHEPIHSQHPRQPGHGFKTLDELQENLPEKPEDTNQPMVPVSQEQPDVAARSAPANEASSPPANDTLNAVAVTEVAVTEVAINEVAINEVAINEVAINEVAINEVAINEVAVNEAAATEAAATEAAATEAAAKVAAANTAEQAVTQETAAVITVSVEDAMDIAVVMVAAALAEIENAAQTETASPEVEAVPVDADLSPPPDLEAAVVDRPAGTLQAEPEPRPVPESISIQTATTAEPVATPSGAEGEAVPIAPQTPEEPAPPAAAPFPAPQVLAAGIPEHDQSVKPESPAKPGHEPVQPKQENKEPQPEAKGIEKNLERFIERFVDGLKGEAPRGDGKAPQPPGLMRILQQKLATSYTDTGAAPMPMPAGQPAQPAPEAKGTPCDMASVPVPAASPDGQSSSTSQQQEHSQSHTEQTALPQGPKGAVAAEATASEKFSQHLTQFPGRLQAIQQVMDRIRLLHNQGKHALQLALKPAELGRVFLEMSRQNGQLSLHLFTESHAATQALEAGLTQLKQSLQNQGLPLHQVSIQTDPQKAGSGDAQQDRRSEEPSRSRAPKAAKVSLEGDDDDLEQMELERRLLVSHLVNYLV